MVLAVPEEGSGCMGVVAKWLLGQNWLVCGMASMGASGRYDWYYAGFRRLGAYVRVVRDIVLVNWKNNFGYFPEKEMSS